MELVLEKRIGRRKRVLVFKETSPKNTRWAMWCNEIWKLCIKSDWKFPNELCYDFKKGDIEEVKKKYFVFLLNNEANAFILLSWFEHKRVTGFIAIPKTITIDTWAWVFERSRETTEKTLTEDEALHIATLEINQFNAYLKGDMFVGIEETLVSRKSDDWREKYERERLSNPILWFTSVEEAVNFFI